METIRTIKIFLASSEELKDERIKFGNFIREIDDDYEPRGIRIKLINWENLISGDCGRPKQDEYNDKVRECDIFIAIFHTIAGEHTIEEYNIAKQTQNKIGTPIIYVFCQELKETEREDSSLSNFKEKLLKEIRHYWDKYQNSEMLQLKFVKQLIKLETRLWDDLKVEDGIIRLGNKTIAQMDKLQFAAANKDYIRMQTDLNELHDEIEEKQRKLEKKKNKLERKKSATKDDPDDEDAREEYEDTKADVDELVDELQPKLNKYNKLKEEFAEYQKLLFNTAKRVAQLQDERITKRMCRAKDAFNEGKVREANIILDEAEADAQRNLEDYKQSKKITEQKRLAIISNIDELLLRISTVMADCTVTIDERIAKVIDLYAQTDETSLIIDYDKEKHAQLLYEYTNFLDEYAYYEKAIEVIQRQIKMIDSDCDKKALSYLRQGMIYYHLASFNESIKSYEQALLIQEKTLSPDHPDLANTYNRLAEVLNTQGEYERAIGFAKLAQKREDTLGSANYYDNLVPELWHKGEKQKALEYSKKAKEIKKKLLDKKTRNGNATIDRNALLIEFANSQRSVGDSYRFLGEHENSLKEYKEALQIHIDTLGENHPETALSYGCVGVAYLNLKNYHEALKNTLKGMDIREYKLGNKHPKTAESYYWLGEIYSQPWESQDYDMALKYLQKAKSIREKAYGLKHKETLFVYNKIGDVCYEKQDYEASKAYYIKCLQMINLKGTLSRDDVYTIMILNNSLGLIERMLPNGDFNIEWSYFSNALDKYKTIVDEEDATTATLYYNIACACEDRKNYSVALEYYQRALPLYEKFYNDDVIAIANLHTSIGMMYFKVDGGQELKENITKENEHIKHALDICVERYGVNSIETANVYQCIGTHYYDKEDYGKAQEYYFKALDIRGRECGNESIEAARSYNDIGTLYFAIKDYKNALQYFSHANSIKEKVLRNDNSEYKEFILSYGNLATTLQILEDYNKALEYYQKELVIVEKKMGVGNPSIAAIYYNIGLTLFLLEKYNDALEYFVKSMIVREKVLGNENIETINTTYYVGLAYYYLGKYDNALKYLEKAIKKQEKVLGKKHNNTASTHYWIGLTYYNLHNYNVALEHFEKALKVYGQLYGKNHIDTASIYYQIGITYYDLDDLTKALEYNFRSLLIREKELGTEHLDTANSYYIISLVYYRLNDFSKALEYIEKAMKIRKGKLSHSHPDIIMAQNLIDTIKVSKRL